MILMKKLLIMLAFAFISQAAMAQNGFRADVQKVLQMTGSAAQADIAKAQIVAMIPEAKKAEFIKEFDALVPEYLNFLEKFYMETFTHDEVKQMIKFYETPVGKKITANAGGLAEATTKAAQDWAPKLQNLVMKYMQ
jgi:uncharacterized protein